MIFIGENHMKRFEKLGKFRCRSYYLTQKIRSSQKKNLPEIPCWSDCGKNRRFRLRLVSFEEPPVPKKKETGASGSVRKRKLLAHGLLLFFHFFFV